MTTTSTSGDLILLRQDARNLKDKVREALRDAAAKRLNSDSPYNERAAQRLAQALIDLRNAECELDLALDCR